MEKNISKEILPISNKSFKYNPIHLYSENGFISTNDMFHLNKGASYKFHVRSNVGYTDYYHFDKFNLNNIKIKSNTNKNTIKYIGRHNINTCISDSRRDKNNDRNFST